MMDWFSTAVELAGVSAPSDRIIDGISLVSLFRNSTEVSDRYSFLTFPNLAVQIKMPFARLLIVPEQAHRDNSP